MNENETNPSVSPDDAVFENLKIPMPEGFHRLGESEFSAYTFSNQVPDWCISDPERHIVITAVWKKNGFFAAILPSSKVAKTMETLIETSMAPYGYELKRFVTEDLGGRRACGFRYNYEAEGVGMTGESLSVKKGSVFYYIHCYYRQELSKESRPVLEDFFRSFEWR